MAESGWSPSDVGAVTRNPWHRLGQTGNQKYTRGIYTRSLDGLTITLDGNPVDNKLLLDAYIAEGYVNLITLTEGEITTTDHKTPHFERFEGKVEIQGEVRNCTSCELNKCRRLRWWNRDSCYAG